MKAKRILVAATISIILALPACHPATIGIEEQQENNAVTNSYYKNMEWHGNMAVNKEIILENLTMISFSEENINGVLKALEDVGIGTITEIESEPGVANPELGERGEWIDAKFSDDLGNTFLMHIDAQGDLYHIHKTDINGDKCTITKIPSFITVD